MSVSRKLLTGAMLLAGAIALSSCASADRTAELNVGADAHGELCRAVESRNDEVAGQGRVFYLYCGGETRPSARVFAWDGAAPAQGRARLLSQCIEPRQVAAQISGFDAPEQFSCAGRVADLGLAQRTAISGFVIVAQKDGRTLAAEGVDAAMPAAVRGLHVLAAGGPSSGVTHEAGAHDSVAALEADARRRASDSALGVYQAQMALGEEYNARWRFSSASAAYLNALAAHQQAAPADLSGRAELIGEIALNLSDQGRFGEALAQLDEAERMAQTAQAQEQGLLGSDFRARYVRAKLASYRAQHFANAGAVDQALAAAARAEAQLAELAHLQANAGPSAASAIAARDPGAARQIVVVDRAASRALGSVDDLRSALRFGSPQISDAHRIAVLQAQSAHLRASMLQRGGRAGADEALEQANAHLANVPPQAAMWLRAVIAQERARLMISGGRAGEAENVIRTALNQYRQSSDGTRIGASLYISLARAEAAGGDRAAALQEYERAFAIYRSQLEEPGVAADQALEYVRLLLAGESANAPDAQARAFAALQTVVEPGVARTIALMAARAGAGDRGAPVRALQDADRRLISARAVVASAIAQGAPEEAQAELSAQLVAAEAARSSALAAVEGSPEGRAYLRLISIDTAAPAISSALAADEGFLQVVIDEQGAYGALVTRGGLSVRALTLTQTEASRLVQGLRRSLTNPDRTEFDFAGARALYQAVLAPFEADMRAAGVAKISYSLPSQLATIPLAVTLAADPSAAELQTAARNDFSGLRWAGRDFVFSQAVSASSFVSLRGLAASQARTPFLGYGDFLPAHQVRPERLSQIVREAALPPECVANLRQRLGQARLPGTAAELTQVRALLNLQQSAVRLGADFTDQSVRGDGRLGDARVVMFATHGLLNEDNCFTEPALITSLAPDSGDGFLEISDIAEMQLNADLAILSACDTAAGRGSGRDPGEAFDGLARAFFYAGARSVLASHWRVFDASASRMMRDFFVNAQQGRPVADALAQAQRGLMAQAPTSHPAHWGAMVAVGDGGRVLNFSSPI